MNLPGPVPSRGPAHRTWAAAVGLVAAVLLAGSLVPPAGAGPVPIPIVQDSRILSNLSAPVLAPGGSGVIAYQLEDPLSAPWSGVSLELTVYAFSPAPGGTTGPVPSDALSLLPSGAPGTTVDVRYAALPVGVPIHGSVGVTASGGAPDGGYAVRFALAFSMNGSSLRMESRGFFPDAQWRAATLPQGPNGSSTVNLSRLGVDGVLPETAVGVHRDVWVVPVLVLAGAGATAAVFGAIGYVRWGPGSKSGATDPEAPQRARRAVGK